jgi:hypothetical protein
VSYRDPSAVWTPPNSSVKIDPYDPAFSMTAAVVDDASLPAIYLFSNSRDGDGVAYAMAEDGTVLGSHFCSHWGYMRHDLHDRPDRRAACEAHYPDGYRLVVLMGSGELPPDEVIERNREQGREATS